MKGRCRGNFASQHMNNNFTINHGICEGILVGDIFRPSDDIAIITVKTKDQRIRPNTQRPTVSYIQFTAFDELATSIAEEYCSGALVAIEYEITTSKKTDEKGITKFHKNRIIKSFKSFFVPVEGQHVPYINFGIAQGEFAGIKKASKSSGIYFLNIKLVSKDNMREKVYYPQFTVYGDKFAMLFEKYNIGDTITVTYKIETEKKNISGEEEFFTDYIVTEVK